MKIKMLKTKKGSPDGTAVNNYLRGQDYDIPNSLANVFINQLQVAEEIKSKFFHVDPPLVQEIEISGKKIDIEVPEKTEMETPMKTIERPKRKRGRPKKIKE